MIKFNQEGPKLWSIEFEEKETITFNLMPSTVTNKYYIVTDFIKRLADYHGEAFSEWFNIFLKDCMDPEKKTNTIHNAIEPIKKFTDEYLCSLCIDYSQFVDKSKAKKNSILFGEDEIQKIIHLSCYLKLYSVVGNSEYVQVGKTINTKEPKFTLGTKLHRDIYNKLSKELIENEVAAKIFDVIKTKTFRYNLTDKFMWDYIKTIQCKDVGIHIVEIFNFIMNNIIILCEEDKNPITYFVGVIDESVKWFLRSVYKGTIVYDDEIATEDIHSTHINNLRTYSFNDTLGRLKGVAFEKIYDKLEQENIANMNDQTDQYIIDFNGRLSEIQYISPLCSCVVFPMLSKITDISYVHFKTISPEHSAVLSYYLNRLLEKVFKGDFQELFSLLNYYPESQPSLNTTYKIKSVHEFINVQNSSKNFFGFNTKMPPHKMLCHFIGRVSRINFTNLLTGKRLTGIPLSKIENDMIHFHTHMFAGDFDSQIEAMTNLMNGDF